MTARMLAIAGTALALLALAGGAGATEAPAAAASFRVGLDLFALPKNEGNCERFEDGRLIRVTCDDGASRPAPLQLFLFRNNVWQGTLEATTGTGTFTSWRVVRSEAGDYLEFLVGW